MRLTSVRHLCHHAHYNHNQFTHGPISKHMRDSWNKNETFVQSILFVTIHYRGHWRKLSFRKKKKKDFEHSPYNVYF